MSEADVTTPQKPQTFRAPARDWWLVVAFGLLLALVGLRFFPALLPLAMFLLWRFRTDLYSFLIEAFIVMGNFAFKANDVLPFKSSDIALMLGVLGIFIYRKNKVISRISWAMLAYFAVLILLAMTSVESMRIQFVMMRYYIVIIAFFIPLLIFANRKFDWDRFIHTLVLHALVICGFYVVDTFIFNGFILLPGALASKLPSTFYDPYFKPLSFITPRHYPYGLYWLVLCIMPLTMGKIRLSWPQWVMIALTLFASRTNSLLFALIVCFIFFRPNIRQVARFALIGVVALTAGYYIDNATGRAMRLADNIDQFTSLEAAQDDEDLAEFGTGRMAQILPKWALLSEMGRFDRGFGFLHPTLTTNPIFQIRNDYYTDVTQADELATAVEVTQVQTILDCGFIGLAAQFAFYIGIYFIIRRLKYAKYYLCAFVGMSVLGIGGFAGVTQPDGLLIISIALASVLLANKERLKAQQNKHQDDSENNPLLLAE